MGAPWWLALVDKDTVETLAKYFLFVLILIGVFLNLEYFLPFFAVGLALLVARELGKGRGKFALSPGLFALIVLMPMVFYAFTKYLESEFSLAPVHLTLYNLGGEPMDVAVGVAAVVILIIAVGLLALPLFARGRR